MTTRVPLISNGVRSHRANSRVAVTQKKARSQKIAATEGGMDWTNGSDELRTVSTMAEPVTPATMDNSTRMPIKRTTAR